MPISLEGTVGGRSLEARAEARGEAAAAVEMLTLLQRRFGEDPRITHVAEELSAQPRSTALDLALNLMTLDGSV